ncbi:Eco57I restriction-modification methylase domain-containing protein [Paracoccus sediminis]|uniref:site-specific DNA-methyltransferase (adenine-specific) n=1 Tax=Paracoccus sediminis TaxID=1214787 RepID=A0A238XM13_9RHOB|nr:Eco57I restriction-modification methylase domain-containing protein [Paracoccus sediminis]SNR60025.1 adenine-specific DNA-methyltransferase [Paracoccus sediminis]
MAETALAVADGHRREVSPGLDEDGRKRLGQFMTPTGIARMLAGHFLHMPSEVRLLDAGAGMGALTAAFVEAACNHPVPPRSIDVTCYEVDPDMVAILRETLARCATDCARAGIAFHPEVVADDYILRSAEPLLAAAGRFNCAILNPPYGKINAGSKWRAALRSQGIETVNLYTAFVALALQQLELGGELVAITPRSFCNGSYYEPFRRLMLDLSALLAIHVFESRRSAFRDDDVLQENVIFHLRRGVPQNGVALSTDLTPAREVHFSEIVRPGDRHAFIRLPVGGATAADLIQSLPCTLADLGLTVSTGRVVDFRAKEHLRRDPGSDTVPLIYPGHFDGATVRWPREGFKKHNAIYDCPQTDSLMVPGGTYVLTKRFTAKEEKRRVVAAVYTGERAGFENHINYFHAKGAGLPERLAVGLARFLNSEAVDTYFRTFSGHTQVNATDLRNLHYPSRGQLEALAGAEDVEGAIAGFAG